MNSIVNCKLNGKTLKVTANAIEIADAQLQIELVKRLIECRALTPVGDCPLPRFFNKYLRNYEITNVVFTEEKPKFYYEPEFDDHYIDEHLAGIAA